MASYEKYYSPSVLARIGRLELRAKMVVEGTIAGMHKSPYHGQSVEFVDHRPYVPGDDLRHLDWKVYGRADRYVLKRYEEETNLRGHLLLDCSESMRYGSRDAMTKYDYAGTMAASIAYLLQKQHDAVSLALFDTDVRERIPASTHPSILLRIADLMDGTPAQGKTALDRTLGTLAESLPRRGLVVLISDLFGTIEELTAGLQALTLRGHDLIVFHVLDETELSFPFEGNILFRGLEDYPEVVADPRSLRDAYLEALHVYFEDVEKVCAGLGLNYFRTDTGKPLDEAIIAVIAARAQLGRRRR